MPFVCYLRVYEPLAAFEPVRRTRIEAALRAGSLSPERAGERERELWLRAQLAIPPRLLPAERPDGTAAPDLPMDVLHLDCAEVPSGPDAPVANGPLVCPLDLRPRAAAALVGFLATAPPTLRRAALPLDAEAVRGRAEAVVAELGGRAVHVVSSTWTVPLPWFALVDPEARRLDLVPRPDPARRVCWRAAMADARRRVARAHAVLGRAVGEDGPARVLRDTGRWLQHFDPHAAVELDYGGLVQLMDDDTLVGDTSAADVQAAVDGLESGDAEQVGLHYERLRDFWGELAAFERMS